MRCKDAADVEDAATAIATELVQSPSVVRVIDRAPSSQASIDPTLAWAYARTDARAPATFWLPCERLVSHR